MHFASNKSFPQALIPRKRESPAKNGIVQEKDPRFRGDDFGGALSS